MNQGAHVAQRTTGSLRRTARDRWLALFVPLSKVRGAISAPNRRSSMGNTPWEVCHEPAR
jgi:hypothetical protein